MGYHISNQSMLSPPNIYFPFHLFILFLINLSFSFLPSADHFYFSSCCLFFSSTYISFLFIIFHIFSFFLSPFLSFCLSFSSSFLCVLIFFPSCFLSFYIYFPCLGFPLDKQIKNSLKYRSHLTFMYNI